MHITVKINNQEDIRLFILTKEGQEESNIFILVDEKNNTPYMELQLESNNFKILDKNICITESENDLKDKLNALFVEVIEAIQQGKDFTEKNTTDEQNPYDPDKIRVETKNFSLRQICDMIKFGDINLSPDFQRHLVWDSFRKSRLIESILLRIPLPMFYFSQDDEGILSVVDGLQRLSAIKEFVDNEFPLRSLEYLESCEGKYYSKETESIDPKFIRWFNMTQITVNIVDPQSPFKVKYDIFRRINTGGKPLNSQELRNCLAHNDLRELLRTMAQSDSFLNATGGSISDVRMDAQEFALRFIYFYQLYEKGNLEKYTGTIDTELDALVEVLSKIPYSDLEKYIDLYNKAMVNAEYLFGKHAFRKINKDSTIFSGRSPINKALFVSWSVLLSQYDSQVLKEKNEQNKLIQVLGKVIDNDSQLRYYLSYGTNGKANILYAFNAVEKIVKQEIL